MLSAGRFEGHPTSAQLQLDEKIRDRDDQYVKIGIRTKKLQRKSIQFNGDVIHRNILSIELNIL